MSVHAGAQQDSCLLLLEHALPHLMAVNSHSCLMRSRCCLVMLLSIVENRSALEEGSAAAASVDVAAAWPAC